MANEWHDLIDDSLEAGFDAPVYKPETGRNALVKALETAKKQHGEGSTRGPNRMWKAGNNAGIRLSPKLSGQPVKLRGKDSAVVHESRFADFLDKLIAATKAGELDAEIKAALDAKGSRPARSSSSKPRKASTGEDDGLGDIRKSVGALMGRYKKSATEAKAAALAKSEKEGKGWSEADVDTIIAEKIAELQG